MAQKKLLVKINGFSCFPDLLPGKIYLAKKIKKPKKGDFLIFKHKKDLLVKKIKKITKKYIILEDSFKNIYTIKNNKKVFLKLNPDAIQ